MWWWWMGWVGGVCAGGRARAPTEACHWTFLLLAAPYQSGFNSAYSSLEALLLLLLLAVPPTEPWLAPGLSHPVGAATACPGPAGASGAAATSVQLAEKLPADMALVKACSTQGMSRQPQTRVHLCFAQVGCQEWQHACTHCTVIS